MHYQVNDVPVRIEKIAMLENPTDMNQAKFLLTLSSLRIPARISDTGDVSVSKEFIHELLMEEFVDDDMHRFILKNDVDSIVFIETLVTR